MIALVVVILAILAIIGAGLIYVLAEPGSGYGLSDAYIGANILLGVGLVVGIVFVIPTGAAIVDQNSLVNDVTRSCADQRIDQRRQDTLLPQFRALLVEEYPQYERQVFAGLTVSSASQFFARFPDLRVADTYKQYVNKLDKLNADVFNEQHTRKQDVADGKSNQDNPWYLGTVLRDVTDRCSPGARK